MNYTFLLSCSIGCCFSWLWRRRRRSRSSCGSSTHTHTILSPSNRFRGALAFRSGLSIGGLSSFPSAWRWLQIRSGANKKRQQSRSSSYRIQQTFSHRFFLIIVIVIIIGYVVLFHHFSSSSNKCLCVSTFTVSSYDCAQSHQLFVCRLEGERRGGPPTPDSRQKRR